MAETGIPPAWVRCPAQRWPPACYATFGCIAAQRERAPRCGRGTRCDPTEDCNRMVTRRPLRPGRGRRDRRHSGGTPKQDQPTVGAAWKYHVLPGRRTRRPQCTCTRAERGAGGYSGASAIPRRGCWQHLTTAATEAVGNSCSNGDGGDGDMVVWDFISARPPPRRRCARLLSHLPDGGVALTALTPVRSAATLWGGGRGVSGVGLGPLSRLHRTI